MADVESKCIPHELPSSHWLKATGQCVLERYLSATMGLKVRRKTDCDAPSTCYVVPYVLCPRDISKIVLCYQRVQPRCVSDFHFDKNNIKFTFYIGLYKIVIEKVCNISKFPIKTYRN